MDRIFLDANFLFSAAYTSFNGLLGLWKLDDVELITSALAVNKAVRNLPEDEQRRRLHNLLTQTTIVPEPKPDIVLPNDVQLAAKDVPILGAAIAAHASHLLTGDKRHFGPLFGRTVGGVLIQRPSVYFASRVL